MLHESTQHFALSTSGLWLSKPICPASHSLGTLNLATKIQCDPHIPARAFGSTNHRAPALWEHLNINTFSFLLQLLQSLRNFRYILDFFLRLFNKDKGCLFRFIFISAANFLRNRYIGEKSVN
jgi:hypothetical protein